MATSDEWIEIVEWIADRFPDNQWRPEQAVAYFHDLEGQKVSDVWAGLLSLYEAGLSFTPNGSQLLAASRKASRESAMADRYKGLPEDTTPPAPRGKVDEWIVARFAEDLTGAEIVERLHRESPPCKNNQCEIHYPTGGTQ